MSARFTVAILALLAAWNVSAEEVAPRVVTQDPTYLTTARAPDPWLIPVRLLVMPYESWSQDNKTRAPRTYSEQFNDQVETARRLGLSGECTPADGLASHGSRFSVDENDPPLSAFEVAGTRKNILIGDVIGTEPAWDAMTRQIATLVHFKVTRVVRALDLISVGDVVTFRRNWGTITVRGVTICSFPGTANSPPLRPWQNAPERQRPTFMILGRLMPGNGFYINTSGFEEFPVIDGFIHYPQGYFYYRDMKPERLDALISRFQETAQ